LYQKLVPPTIQRIEALRVIDIIDKDAAVGAAVECNTEGLEAFLAGGVPELEEEV